MDQRSTDGRGRYDRLTGASGRLVDQRARLLEASTTLLAQGEKLTVESLTRAARLGRNTFYVHFSDVGDIQDAVIHGATRRLQASLQQAIAAEVTPLSRVVAVCRTWLVVSAQDVGLRGVVGTLSCRRSAAIRGVLEDALVACIERAHQDGLVGRPARGWRIAACVGAITETGWRGIELEQSAEDVAEQLGRLIVSAFR